MFFFFFFFFGGGGGWWWWCVCVCVCVCSLPNFGIPSSTLLKLKVSCTQINCYSTSQRRCIRVSVAEPWKQIITRMKMSSVQRERDVAQSIACPPLKRSVVGSILLSGRSRSLGYFPFQPVVHNWFIKARGIYCSVYGKVHIKDPLLIIEKSSLCGGSGFPSKKCVNVTIWMTSNNRW